MYFFMSFTTCVYKGICENLTFWGVNCHTYFVFSYKFKSIILYNFMLLLMYPFSK